jgi:hypothetical protein
MKSMIILKMLGSEFLGAELGHHTRRCGAHTLQEQQCRETLIVHKQILLEHHPALQTLCRELQ